jgi:glutamate-ammonia-ligase adenylyltransferase
MATLDRCIELAPDPQSAEHRLAELRSEGELRRRIDALDEDRLRQLAAVISVSHFLYHLLRRHPDIVEETGRPPAPDGGIADCVDAGALRLAKYRQLYRIACMDLEHGGDYRPVLEALTALAEAVLRQALRLVDGAGARRLLHEHVCILALGKLGAGEINFSSDVDLLFVCSNHEASGLDIDAYQKRLMDGLRGFTRLLEQHAEDGFLYRVDLNLRPWGRSGPLFMAIDDMEHYYEASSDAWERFAWLRARPVAGAMALGADLRGRLSPFMYLRSLSADDLARFVDMKRELSRVRQRSGYWNVKLGDGGIRDIEFFIQTLQLVNAAHHAGLQGTNTLETLHGLVAEGLVSAADAAAAERSYLFLRRLENHLQMRDEQQTHELPDGQPTRLVLARSLGIADGGSRETLDRFEAELLAHRAVARGFFERILPADGG